MKPFQCKVFILNSKEQLVEIMSYIKGLTSDWRPIVIRKGKLELTPEEWKSFLAEQCGLHIDRRHHNIEEKIQLSDWWEISYQPEKSISYAYSNTRQPLHNDNAWFSDPAEINFFIQKKQARSGGAQSIYPIERLMSDLSDEEKGLFDDLRSIPVIIKKGDGEFFNDTTIIVDGAETKVFWNYYRTEKPNYRIKDMCEAFFKYLEKKESTSSVEYLQCDSGDCFSFNDLKLLHGRTAFEASQPYDRILFQSMWSLNKK